MNIELSTVAIIVASVNALLTTCIGIPGVRWSKQVVEAKDAKLEVKDAQIAQLKDIVSNMKDFASNMKDLSAPELQKNIAAWKEAHKDLDAKLTDLSRLYREKSAEVTSEKKMIAQLTGIGKLFLGISNSEVMVRKLHGLIYNMLNQPIDYGEQELAIWSFYLNAISLVLPDQETTDEVVGSFPEWVLDYLVLPLLSCMRFRSIRVFANNILLQVYESMEHTPFSREVPIYREALSMAAGGADFREGLPKDLRMKLMKISEEDSRQRAITALSNPGLDYL